MARNYPAIGALAAVVAGIILADVTGVDCLVWMAVLVATVPAILACFFAKRVVLTSLMALVGLTAFSAFGYGYRYGSMPPGHIGQYAGDGIIHDVFGTVVDWPAIKEHRTDLVLRVDSIGTNGIIETGKGRLLLRIQTPTTRLQYGDRLYFKTRLYPIRGGQNPTGFDYRRYLNLRGIFAVAYLPNPFSLRLERGGTTVFLQLIDRLRGEITNVFYSALDPTSAAIASGFLIGETRNIPPRIYELFRDTGTLHLLAVSGSNVALVVLVFVYLLRASPLTLRGRTMVLLVVVFLFSYLAYNQPSVVRASVMAALVLIGKAFQRRIDLNNIIATAALIILLVCPTELFDVGFQLSFVTAWALIVITPMVSHWLERYRQYRLFHISLMSLAVCVIAQIASLPMSAYYFQRVPLIAFFSNLVIVPLVGVTVLGEMVLLFAWLILPLLGQFVGSLLNPVFHGIVWLLEWFGSEGVMVSLTYHLSGIALIGYYILLGLAVRSVSSRLVRRVFVFAVLITPNILLLIPIVSADREYASTVFSVPCGIIAVNRFDQTQVVLGGLSFRNYAYTENIIEPYVHNLGLSIDRVIALDGDYQTIHEAVFLLKSEPSAVGYFPDYSRPLTCDICRFQGIAIDSLAAVFFGASDRKTPMPADGQWAVSHDGLFCRFDSSAVLFRSDRDGFAPLFAGRSAFGVGLTVVTPVLDAAGMKMLDSVSADDLQCVVCNKLARGLRSHSAESDWCKRQAERLVVTSQVGAVELVVCDGRITVR
ncbi:MAG: ComEC family competence protein [candidate division Zixibacteria bacterium]|nr:ComEC family competence protein [candidate division Zixibacteria bacterium]